MPKPQSSLALFCAAIAFLVNVFAPAPLASQDDRFSGRWVGSEPDRGVLVSIVIGTTNTLTLPGMRVDGSVQAMTLPLRNLMIQGDLATFSVDLPEHEGTLGLELRVAAADDSAALRVVRVDDAAIEDLPTWIVRRVR